MTTKEVIQMAERQDQVQEEQVEVDKPAEDQPKQVIRRGEPVYIGGSQPVRAREDIYVCDPQNC